MLCICLSFRLQGCRSFDQFLVGFVLEAYIVIPKFKAFIIHPELVFCTLVACFPLVNMMYFLEVSLNSSFFSLVWRDLFFSFLSFCFWFFGNCVGHV